MSGSCIKWLFGNIHCSIQCCLMRMYIITLRFSTKKFAPPKKCSSSYFLSDNESYVSCWIFLFTLAIKKLRTRFSVQLKYVSHYCFWYNLLHFLYSFGSCSPLAFLITDCCNSKTLRKECHGYTQAEASQDSSLTETQTKSCPQPGCSRDWIFSRTTNQRWLFS